MKHFCAHCPHYTRDEATVKCMFFWGMPKFFKSRPGPLSPTDKTVSLAAPAVVGLFPLPWLLAEPGLLVIYLLSLVGFAMTVRRYECVRCVYSHCPSNMADAQAQQPAADGE